MLSATLLLPTAHFIYIKQHWHPGQYETHGPSLAQFIRMVSALKGAMSLEFMAVGIVLAFVSLYVSRRSRIQATAAQGATDGEIGSETPLSLFGPAVLSAVVLVAGGIVVYLPVEIMSGRYAMPAVHGGLDILFAVFLTTFTFLPLTYCKKSAWAGLCTALAVIAVANVGKQQKFAARANMLWDAVHYVESTAPKNAHVAWISGDNFASDLNVEEGIHFPVASRKSWSWRRENRSLQRKWKQTQANRAPFYSMTPDSLSCSGKRSDEPAGWEPERTFVSAYWLGRKQYHCHLGHKSAAESVVEAARVRSGL